MLGIQDPARQPRVLPRQGAELQVRAHHGGEEPCTDDVLPLGAQVHGVDAGEEVFIGQPAAGQLGGQGRGGPCVHDVHLADEAAGRAPLLLGVTGGRIARGVDGQDRLVGGEDGPVVDLAVSADLVP